MFIVVLVYRRVTIFMLFYSKVDAIEVLDYLKLLKEIN